MKIIQLIFGPTGTLFGLTDEGSTYSWDAAEQEWRPRFPPIEPAPDALPKQPDEAQEGFLASAEAFGVIHGHAIEDPEGYDGGVTEDRIGVVYDALKKHMAPGK